MATGLRGDLCNPNPVARFSRPSTTRRHRRLSKARPPLRRTRRGRKRHQEYFPQNPRRDKTLISPVSMEQDREVKGFVGAGYVGTGVFPSCTFVAFVVIGFAN